MVEEIKLHNKYEITILKQDDFGNGITKINDKFVFIEKGLVGDKCLIEITEVKKKYAKGKILKIIDSSNDRVDAKCPYYDSCGGCHIMHQSYNKQLEYKENKVKGLLEKFTGLSDVNVLPIIYDKQFYYRNKIILHSDKNKLGFYKGKTHDLVPVDECIITNEKINKIYERIKEYLLNSNDYVNEIMFRISSLNELMIVLKGNIDVKKFISKFNDIDTIYINNGLVKGNSYILEDILGIKFHIYPTSFFQVNYDMMVKLYSVVSDFYKTKNYNKVLDLYCGTGTIGMLISKYVKNVVGVELEPSSIVSANECKKINNINNIEFIEGKVEDRIDLFNDIDSIVVDPPRSGLDNHTIDIMLDLLPKSIVYISCDPVTLARDLKLLLDKYEIIKIQPVDMFPNTYHVECVCVLKRKQTFEI